MPDTPDIGGYVPPEPIHQENDEWYFWDETWAHRYGPYLTKEIAVQQLEDYCKYLNGEM